MFKSGAVSGYIALQLSADNLIGESMENKNNRSASQVVVQDVMKIKKGERVLIIANPETYGIAQNLYNAVEKQQALPTLIIQPDKTSFDNANEETLQAIATAPDVCFSISNIKLGKDPHASASPYKTDDGNEFTHIFDYLLDGKKVIRAAWTPGITQDMMDRTAAIDYHELQNRCKVLEEKFTGAVSVVIKAPGGTDITISVEKRKLMFDDGDFSKPGTGGNIPAGEVFISPVVGKSNGKIVFDGSMTFSDGDSILNTPIYCDVENGFVTKIEGGSEAQRLLQTITEAENRAVSYEREGKLPQGQGEIYKKNARNIGELGIGLNPNALITGNMLEDEKAFHTCHFAIGENYDNDAPSLIHLDGVVKNPTITIFYADGSLHDILKDGNLQDC